MAEYVTELEFGLVPDAALPPMEVRFTIDWLGEVEQIELCHATRKGGKWVALDKSNPVHRWFYNEALRQLSETAIDDARREALAEREDDAGDYAYHQSVGQSLTSEAWS